MVHGLAQLLLVLVGELLLRRGCESSMSSWLSRIKSRNWRSQSDDGVGLDLVQVAVRRGEQDHHLLLDGHRVALVLLEDRREPLAAVERLLRRLVQVAAELGEALPARGTGSGRACSVPATLFMALIWAEQPTRLTELPVSMAGRWPELKRSASRKIWPSVMEMTFVGMYAEMSPALVSITGSAVSDPPPASSESLAARSSRRECR